ncbi:MAG: hypothetical protein PVI99_02170 [Anaerolineales bacterium]|jgi:hypothetical protein
MAAKYHSFLVRLWESENNGNLTLHISLESSKGGEKKYFSNLDDLLDFFENLMGAHSASRGNTEGADQ